MKLLARLLPLLVFSSIAKGRQCHGNGIYIDVYPEDCHHTAHHGHNVTTTCESLDGALSKIYNIVSNQSNMSIIEYDCVHLYMHQDKYWPTKAFSLTKTLSLANLKEFYMVGTVVINCNGSGIELRNISTVQLNGVQFNGCESLSFILCESLTLKFIQVTNSKGTGLHMLNNRKTTIENCNMLYNGQSMMSRSDSRVSQDIGKAVQGGGLYMKFNNISNQSVFISKCTFMGNLAAEGGGIFIDFYNSIDNTVQVESSTFEDNAAIPGNSSLTGSGGGVKIVSHNQDDAAIFQDNAVIFPYCTFINNYADLGGGIAFEVELYPSVALDFNSCNWIHNHGWKGSAIYLTTTSLTTTGCVPTVNFTRNEISNNIGRPLRGQLLPTTVYIDSIPIQFLDFIDFFNNSCTALTVYRATVYFVNNCTANFTGNRGYDSGAMKLLNGALVKVEDGSSLVFKENKAEAKGDAIYDNSNYYISPSQSCFKQYLEDHNVPHENWGENFTLLILSILSCTQRASGVHANTDSPCCLQQNTTDCQNFIEREPSKFHCENEDPEVVINVYPGETVSIFNTSIFNDSSLGNDVSDKVIFKAKVRDTITSMVGSPQYISDNTIQFTGKPATYIAYLYTIEHRVFHAQIKVKRIKVKVRADCPTGYTNSSHETSKESDIRCECNKKSQFNGILSCSEKNFSSSLTLQSQWVGFHKNNVFVTGHCPYLRSLNQSMMKLPTNPENVSTYLCSSINRKGTLCGDCIDNYSPAPNSKTLLCMNCDGQSGHGKYGWVWFILMQLLPTTILFLVLVFFNISLTSGPANSFIFFSQVITSSFLQTNNSSGTKFLDSLYTALYEIWNLQFFSFFQYCIHPQAEAMHIIILEYLSALYPFILIFLFYSLIKLYNKGVRPIVLLLRPLHHYLSKYRRQWNMEQSIAHTTAAFTVLSYAKVINASVYLLLSSKLYNQQGEVYDTVVLMQGTMQAYTGTHLVYIIIALTFLAGFGLTLPLLLILYPVKCCHSLLHSLSRGCCNLSGGRLEKFLNVFYSCYKDGMEEGERDLRMYAGLYFAYRLVLAAFNYNLYQSSHYLTQHTFCITAIFLFSIDRPYKKNSWNTLGIAIFFILACLSFFSEYNFNLERTGQKQSIPVLVLEYILIFVPVLCMSIYLIYNIVTGNRFWKQYVSSGTVRYIPNNYRHSEMSCDITKLRTNRAEKEQSMKIYDANSIKSNDSSPILTREVSRRLNTDRKHTRFTRRLDTGKEPTELTQLVDSSTPNNYSLEMSKL